MSWLTRVASYSIAAFTLGASMAYGQDATALRYRPDEIKYIKTATGAESATLYGKPTEAGLFVSRVKIPAGTKVAPHWHPDLARTVVVLSGTLYFGLGETWDDAKLDARPAGTFFSEPPKVAHFAWAKDGEVILQVTGLGPTGTTIIQQPK